jgi:hypothetical protein
MLRSRMMCCAAGLALENGRNVTPGIRSIAARCASVPTTNV